MLILVYAKWTVFKVCAECDCLDSLVAKPKEPLKLVQVLTKQNVTNERRDILYYNNNGGNKRYSDAGPDK